MKRVNVFGELRLGAEYCRTGQFGLFLLTLETVLPQEPIKECT